jgi:hypothetical protein
MGPVSDFGFLVCGWSAIRGAGLEGRLATAAAAPRAGGQGAVQVQGAQPGQQQGAGRWQSKGRAAWAWAGVHLPTYLPMGIAAEQQSKGSRGAGPGHPNPVWVGARSGAGGRANSTGLQVAGCHRRGDGEATGRPRAEGSGGRCPSLWSGPTAAAPTTHPWVCAYACPGFLVLIPWDWPAGP